ncbi:MAG: hypothetical protein QOG42_1010, partial [Solirubrobacteraceae bacterium]|nr:hypothetical protein [Solirubrobacteraceae bacterium]
WTPGGLLAAHTVSLGLHRDLYELGSDRYNTADWLAGARGALAVTYTAPQPTAARPLLYATFAALRRSGGSFGRADRLTPGDVFAAQGSRVAFQPLTGEPVVALPFLVSRTIAVAATVGPPAPAPAR